MSAMMESLSLLSSLHDEVKSENFLEPHYKEYYRVAIDALIEGGVTSYQECLVKEGAAEFLAEDELNYITNHIKKPTENNDNSHGDVTDDTSSSGTYWPIESDVEAPNLELGWPCIAPGLIGATDIHLYFHPPRGHPFTIKEIVRRMIKEARQVVAIVMDMFTDVDIFKELVEASTRGVPVYLLLDEANFSHFLKMTEKQGVQVQRLRNMRVRTVQGQEYLSKSGAKFCGQMEQKFLLVDCEKVLYGTYSFMWSYEKVHLSMVQVITGKLVESFDEEFRTLYARSCIPSVFGPEELIIGTHRKTPWEYSSYQNSRSSILSASSQRSLFGRKDQMHTLDSSYLTRSRFTNNEDDKYGIRNASYRPHHQLGFNVQNKIHHFQQFERHDNWKRHSYAAGEKPESSTYMLLNRGMNNRINNPQTNWNRQVDVSSIGSLSRGGYSSNYNYNGSTQSFANRLSQRQVPNLPERNSNVRRSFHGTDNHVRSIQQKMPTLEHTTKSFLRNWRIESYLNDQADITPDTQENLKDRYEGNEGNGSIAENSLYNQSRLRSSILYKPTYPEQSDANSCKSSSSHSNSTIVDSQGSLTPKAFTPQSRLSECKDSNAFSYDTQHLHQQEILKRHSLQVPESPRAGLNYNTNPTPSSYLYTTLCTSRQSDSVRKQQSESILKRRSLPIFENRKVNVGQNSSVIPHNYIYNTLVRRQTENPVHQNISNSSSSQRLENNVNNSEENTNDKPCNSVVTAALSTETLIENHHEDYGKDGTSKKESKSSPSFLKKGSKKLKSLLSLTPEKKETLSKNKTPAFYRMCSSSDTLISEEDPQENNKKSDSKNDTLPRREKTLSTSQVSLNKSKENTGNDVSPVPVTEEAAKSHSSPASTVVENKFLQNIGDASAPRFNTEPVQFQEAKQYVHKFQYGRTLSPAIQRRDLQLRLQKEAAQREMPPMLQREMHLRHSQHREMHQKEVMRRDMYGQPVTDYPKPQEDLSRTHLSERRIYSRFEPFCKTENTAPHTMPNSNAHMSDFNNKPIGNNYNRPNHMPNYNSSANYNVVLPSENKFGRFMQKFGNFIKKQ
ncbi:protein FAM83B [Pelobates fuscus]|uniref:protein FAM83B n=1 Tax=Pelobates fuscus TaxID=191477 RepID=UPI002FE4BCA6